MKQKAVYQLSAKQIILLGFASALLAVGVVLILNNLNFFSSAEILSKHKVKISG